MEVDVSSSPLGRNRTIDVAKGLGIMLVVFGHNWWVLQHSETLFRVVYSFHVPLFFYLAGIFLKAQEPWSRTVVSKAQALLQPYAVTLLLGVGLALATHSLKLERYVLGALYASGPAIPNPWQALWFLPHLFLALIVAAGLLRLAGSGLQRLWVGLPVAAAILVLGIEVLPLAWRQPVPVLADWWTRMGLTEGMPGLPFSADVLGVSLAFVLAGWVTSPWVRRLKFQPLGLLVALLVFAGLHVLFSQTMDLSMRRYTDMGISTAMAVAGIALVLFLSAGLAGLPGVGRVLSYVGSGSLFVLMFHVFFQVRFTGLVQARWPQWAGLGAVAGWGVGMIVPLLIWEGVKRSKYLSLAFQQNYKGRNP